MVMLINDVPLECINQAAIEYKIPATLIISILKVENGRVGDANKNKNGTFDYGPMQINSSWIKDITKFGYTAEDMQFNPCKNVKVGAWILSQNIASGHTLWQGIGNYHSRTLNRNINYYSKVKVFYALIDTYINAK